MASKRGGLSLAEKITGLVALALGVVLSYYSYNSMEALTPYWGIFMGVGVIMAVIGILLILAKPE